MYGSSVFFIYFFFIIYIKFKCVQAAYLVQRQQWPQGMVGWHELMLHLWTEVAPLPQGCGPALSAYRLVLSSRAWVDDTGIKA